MTTVVVAGALASKPGNAGNAWTRLTWAASFAQLGFDVWLLERLAHPIDAEARAWTESILDAHGLAGRAVVVGPGDDVVVGPPLAGLEEALASAALLFDIGGHLGTTGLGALPKTRAFLDDDPGFTQMWEAADSPGSRLADHDLHLTYGLNIGRPECPVPTVGRVWHPVLPPVLLDAWPFQPPTDAAPFTTVATWRSPFGCVSLNGVTYGLKHHEFRKVLPLPTLVDAAFEVALDIHPGDAADLHQLRRWGWTVVNPRRVAVDTAAYRHFVRSSAAEFSPAQGVYAHAGTGWVSDRTACYLASGRPALVQDTGASSTLPMGEGLVPYLDVEEAAVQAARLLDDLDVHAHAARRLAEEHFDGAKVASRVCELAQVAP